MKPILCHICNRPLGRYKMRNGCIRWACYFPIPEDSEDYVEDETEDLAIITDPKQHGKILRYFASIKYKNCLYYISSDSYSNTSSMIKINQVDDIFLKTKISKNNIPKFYDLKLREPLKPQFEKIFDNLKLLSVFS